MRCGVWAQNVRQPVLFKIIVNLFLSCGSLDPSPWPQTSLTDSLSGPIGVARVIAPSPIATLYIYTGCPNKKIECSRWAVIGCKKMTSQGDD